jgi:transposase
MIQASLDHIEYMEKTIAKLDQQINEKLKDYHRERELLESIPAVKEQGSASILAEIGADMSVFPSADHISAWAGMSPGNNESAGKKKVAKQPTTIKI